MECRKDKWYCPVLVCGYFSVKKNEVVSHWTLTHVHEPSTATTHPRQPYLSTPPLLLESGLLLLSFGGRDHTKFPHCLWCEECQSVVPTDEIRNHWRFTSGNVQQTHAWPESPPKFKKAEVLAAFPNLIRTADEVADIDLRAIDGLAPRRIAHLMYQKLGYACQAPFCGAVAVSQAAFTYHTRKHTLIGHPKPTSLEQQSQKLGRRNNWPSFVVQDLGLDDPGKDQEAAVRYALGEYDKVRRIPAAPLEKLHDNTKILQAFHNLGWVEELKTFNARTIATLKHASAFQRNDPLGLISQSVSNYLGIAGREAQKPERIKLACDVRTEKA